MTLEWEGYEQEVIPGPIPSHCPQCGRENDGTVAIWVQNTSYVENHLNCTTCCVDCQTQNDEYWAERWEEYYGSRF